MAGFNWYTRYKDRTPKWANKRKILFIYEFARKHGKQVDHIVPINGQTVCGLHCEDNLQVVRAYANQRKSNSWPPQIDMHGEDSYDVIQLSLF